MSTTTKELPNPALANAAIATDASHRNDAVGAEIPVIVHASRYSAAKGVGKQLPAVHEETRTVIVFPQGAVVRLSANMTVGELVVLTNRQTGADALCRVVNVKTQPGIQNYVNLEFTQRAPGFWAECIQSDGAEAPVSSSPSVIAMPTGDGMSAPKVATPGPMLVPPVTSGSHAAKSPSLSNSLDSAMPQPASQRASQSWTRPGAQAEESHSNSKTIVLIAVAAVVLLAIGAGGAMLLRQGHSSAPEQQVALNNSPAPAAAQPVAASQPEPVAAQPVSAPAPVGANVPSEPPPAPVTETRPVIDSTNSSKSAAAESSAASRRPAGPSVNVGKISAPIAKAPVQIAPNVAPPMLSAQASIVGSGLGAGLLANPSASGPVAPRPAVGGQIQAPKLISSTSAVYPNAARLARIEGDVMVDLLVDSTGKVTSVQVISGPLALQQAALDAVRTWKYQPAQLNGKPIDIHTRVSLAFHLH